MAGLDGKLIFDEARKLTKNIAYFVPRNTDAAALASLAGKGHRTGFNLRPLPNNINIIKSN